MQSAQTMWQILEIYSDLFPLEKNHLLSQTHYVQDLPDPFARSTLPGHITGSGIVIVDQKMLLIHHRYLKEWFQPGGHVDPGETPDTCAIREVTEEEKKSVLENTKHYQDNWKRYSKSVF